MAVVVSFRELREAAGFTQSELADAANVRQATVSEMERGLPRRIDLDVLERIADALGAKLRRIVEPGELLAREDRAPTRVRRAPPPKKASAPKRRGR
jgi:transcriptional regulator with XRE-family HTH domain